MHILLVNLKKYLWFGHKVAGYVLKKSLLGDAVNRT
jgi:hypothetical protein